MVKYKRYIIYFICSIIIYTLLSWDSILYKPFLSFDESIYICLGRALNNGKIMYTDLYDTKGPIWYILCYLLVKIPINPIYTWFIFNILVNFCIMLMFDKILSIQKEAPIVITIILDIGIFTFITVYSFCSEYTMMPIQLSIVYLLISTLEKNEPLSKKNAYIIGVLFGILVFIKYTLVIVPFVFLVYYTIKQKFNGWLYIIYGGLTVCGIILVKLLIEHSLMDYINVQKSVITNHVQATPINMFDTNTLFIGMIAFVYLVIELLWEQNIYRWLFVICVLLLLVINVGNYYLISLYVFFPVFYYNIDSLPLKRILLLVSMCIVTICLSFYFTYTHHTNQYLYSQIEPYDSIYVTQFPQYYAYKNKELPCYHIDYIASGEDWIKEIETTINTNQYEYLLINKFYNKEIPTNYKLIHNYNDEYILYQRN